MAEQHGRSATHLQVRDGQPLIGIVLLEDGQHVTHYFTDDAEAAAAVSQRQVIEAALATAGAFSDLDYDEAMDALDRIRHASKPTPPIDLDP
jgi:hypothetical protein